MKQSTSIVRSALPGGLEPRLTGRPSWVARALLASLACLAALGACSRPVAQPTRTVRVVGGASDALARTLETDERGLVRVELHEGPTVWVESWRVRDAALEPGSLLAVRAHDGSVRVVDVVESLDRLVVVHAVGGGRELVEIDRVLAVLRVVPALSDPTPPPTPPPPVLHDTDVPPPPPDPDTFATLDTGTDLYERMRIASCEGGQARVLGVDGTVVSVPLRSLRAIAPQAGDRVHAYWQNDETSTYPATVMDVEGRLYSLHYEDGSDAWVALDQIVRAEVQRSATASGLTSCPRGERLVMVRVGALRRVVEVVRCGPEGAQFREPGGSGATRGVTRDALRALAVPDGARVLALWQGSTPYIATASGTTDGVVHLTYEDGSVEETAITSVRWTASDVEPEPYACPLM